MKKLLLLATTLTLLISCTACGEKEVTDSELKDVINSALDDSSSSETEKGTEAPTEAPTEEETEPESEFSFAIKSTSYGKDYEDKDVLIVEYDFTNNSDSATSFSFACQDTAFQDGVECDSTVIGCDEVDTQEQLNDIQSGKTYTLKVGYHVADASKPVDIVVTDLYGQNTLLEQTIEP